MIDEFPPPGWFLQPENRPYWMPSTLLGALPPSAFPSDPSTQFGAHQRQPLLGANSGITAPLSFGLNDTEPAWLSSVKPATDGGLLGFLTHPKDPEDQDDSVWSRLATSSAADGGLFSQLARPNGSTGRGDGPAWPQSLLPFGADAVDLTPTLPPSGRSQETGSSSWPLTNLGIDHGWLELANANHQSAVGPTSPTGQPWTGSWQYPSGPGRAERSAPPTLSASLPLFPYLQPPSEPIAPPGFLKLFGLDEGFPAPPSPPRAADPASSPNAASSSEGVNPFERRGTSNDEPKWSEWPPSLGSVLESALGISPAGAAELRDPTRIGRPELLEGGGPRGSGGSIGGSGWFGSTPTVAKRPTTAAEQLAVNRETGLKFEQVTGEKYNRERNIAMSPQITFRTSSGTKMRMDWVGRDPQTGEIFCLECKASETARLTRQQKKGFPEIQQGGATIVGAGKPDFPGETIIPPTRVRVVRP